MAKELPYFQFEPAEYLTKDISFCSLSAQGLFINICSYYWQRECKITKTQILRRFNYPDLLDELITENVLTIIGEEIKINFLYEQYYHILEDKKESSNKGIIGNLKRWNRPAYDRFINGEITLEEALLIPKISPPDTLAIAKPSQIREEKIKEDKITIKSITSPPEGVAPLYFYIAKGFHNLFLKKGETKTLNNASLTKWVEDTRKIIEIDKVPISQLIAIKRYWEECESGTRGTDNFWFNTINSMSSFRKVDKDGVYHYDKITTSVKKWLNANPELQGEIFKIEQNLISKSNGN